SYLTLINFAPRTWETVYGGLDRKKDLDRSFKGFARLRIISHPCSTVSDRTSWFPHFRPIQMHSSKSWDRTDTAKAWSLSPIQLPSTQPGIAAPPITSWFQTNRAPLCCGQRESCRKKSKP